MIKRRNVNSFIYTLKCTLLTHLRQLNNITLLLLLSSSLLFDFLGNYKGYGLFTMFVQFIHITAIFSAFR